MCCGRFGSMFLVACLLGHSKRHLSVSASIAGPFQENGMQKRLRWREYSGTDTPSSFKKDRFGSRTFGTCNMPPTNICRGAGAIGKPLAVR